MSRFKSWDSHSARWKTQATRDGLTKKRWDKWIQLSPKTQAKTNPRDYAKGESVKDQVRRQLEASVVKHMKRMFGTTSREATIRHGAEEMTNDELRWTLRASSVQIQSRSSRKVATGERNKWWYR